MSVIVRRTPIRKRFMAMAGRPVLFTNSVPGAPALGGGGNAIPRYAGEVPRPWAGSGTASFQGLPSPCRDRIPLGVPGLLVLPGGTAVRAPSRRR